MQDKIAFHVRFHYHPQKDALRHHLAHGGHRPSCIMPEGNPKSPRHLILSIPVPAPAGLTLLGQQPPIPSFKEWPLFPLATGNPGNMDMCAEGPIVVLAGPCFVHALKFPKAQGLSLWDIPPPQGPW